MQENLKTTDAEKPVFWRPLQPGEVIHELVDIAEDPAVNGFPVEAAEIGHPAAPVAEKATDLSPIAGIPAESWSGWSAMAMVKAPAGSDTPFTILMAPLSDRNGVRSTSRAAPEYRAATPSPFRFTSFSSFTL